MSDTIMNGSVSMMPGMILAMGPLCVFLAILPILAAAALVKYLFFTNPPREQKDSNID